MKNKKISVARKLRRRMSPVERRVWQAVRNRRLGYKFRRQHPLGPYVVDFYCAAQKLVIEIDGESHADTAEYDYQREAWLRRQGYRVVRFTNQEVVANLPGVLTTIRNALRESP